MSDEVKDGQAENPALVTKTTEELIAIALKVLNEHFVGLTYAEGTMVLGSIVSMLVSHMHMRPEVVLGLLGEALGVPTMIMALGMGEGKETVH